MFIDSISLSNLLSFGEKSAKISLGNLNMIIGVNGSGKSNLLDAIEILKMAPKENLSRVFVGTGGVGNWLWKNKGIVPEATLDVVIKKPELPQNLRYVLSFTETEQRFKLVDERIENEKVIGEHEDPYFFYRFNNGYPALNTRVPEEFEPDASAPISNEALYPSFRRTLKHEDIQPDDSILSQRKDPDSYPEISLLARQFERIALYRDWNVGRNTHAVKQVNNIRRSQAADLPNNFLDPDGGNLFLVLNKLSRDYAVKQHLLEELKKLYHGIQDIHFDIQEGSVQFSIVEDEHTIPATRLSDGTIRYLCLLAILCHPEPPPLICIEEPELGLHMDILPELARLLQEASERTQIIVTTHSDILIDAMTDKPESVLVAEKDKEGSVIRNLKADNLKDWLEEHNSLSDLWSRGAIGGVRW